MKKATAILLTLLLTLSLAACSSASTTSQPEAASTPATSSVETGTGDVSQKPTVDRVGNPIVVPSEINTIISMAPATTQILIDLGLADKIVAVDTNSADLFPEVEGLVAFDLYAPDLEQMMLLAPDILFASMLSTEGGDSPFIPLQNEGYCVAEFATPDDIAGCFEDVLFVAACVGETEAGEKLVAEAEATIKAVADLAATVDEPKTVLFEIASMPNIYATGSGTYMNELLETAGLVNVLADKTGWLPVAEEAAVAANPDLILTNVTYVDNAVDEILSRTGWDSVTAVANGDVHFIDNAASSLPNTHIAEAAVQIAKAAYPELFASF